MPRVSVLMPVYNVAPFLREAMDSILNQSFRDFELIVLDDCSPDNSEEILDTYSDTRIVRYRGKKNEGLANVLNVGIGMAKGDLIARMDSDDISLSQRLEKQVAFLDAHPDVDLVSAGMERFGDSNSMTFYSTNYEDVKFDALSFSPVLHPTSMWRRTRFIENDLFYRQEMVPSEDYDLWTRALVKGLVLVNMPDILYRYRSHPAQVTRVNKDWSKSTDIGFRYIKTIFPGISEERVRRFHSLRAEKDPVIVKKICKEFEQENKKICFFNPYYLRSRLKKYYQGRLFNQMKIKGIDWQHIFELRPIQWFRLVFKVK